MELLPYSVFACAFALMMISFGISRSDSTSKEYRAREFIAHAIENLVLLESQRPARTNISGVEDTLLSALRTADAEERKLIFKLLIHCYTIDPLRQAPQAKKAYEELLELLSDDESAT
jgi:hypothetical protein